MNGLTDQDFADADAESAYSTESEDIIMHNFEVNTGYRKWTYLVRAGRPLAEPPMLEYDRFIEKKVPSDVRLRILFPNDIQKRTDYGDLSVEAGLQLKYYDWVIDMREAYSEGVEFGFYDGLYRELCEDVEEMKKEQIVKVVGEEVTPLMRWEWENVDQDGGTEKIENKLKEGDPWVWRVDDVVGTYVPEARAKYGHLASREYSPEIAKRVYAIWKKRTLGMDDNTLNLEDAIRVGVDVRAQYGWEEIAEAKHGHLIPEGWRPRKRNDDGGIAPDELYVDVDRFKRPIFTPAKAATSTSSSPAQYSDQPLPAHPSTNDQAPLLSSPAASDATSPPSPTDTPLSHR